jgi:transcriptional regulator with XRE-family HTH domain
VEQVDIDLSRRRSREEIAKDLKEWCLSKEHKITQEALAERLNVDVRTVHRMLNGKGPIRRQYIPELMRITNFPFEFFVGEKVAVEDEVEERQTIDFEIRNISSEDAWFFDKMLKQIEKLSKIKDKKQQKWILTEIDRIQETINIFS